MRMAFCCHLYVKCFHYLIYMELEDLTFTHLSLRYVMIFCMTNLYQIFVISVVFVCFLGVERQISCTYRSYWAERRQRKR